MAKRNVLHISKLENLKKWLVQDGWNILPISNNPYEVLRATKTGKQNPLIIYSGKSEEHLSFADRDMPVIGAFLRDENKSQKNMMHKFDGLTEEVVLSFLRSVQEQNIMRTHHYFSKNQKSDLLRNSVKE